MSLSCDEEGDVWDEPEENLEEEEEEEEEAVEAISPINDMGNVTLEQYI